MRSCHCGINRGLMFQMLKQWKILEKTLKKLNIEEFNFPLNNLKQKFIQTFLIFSQVSPN